MLRKVLALIVFVGLASQATAQDRLAWKFVDGQKFYMQEIMEQKQTVVTGTNKEEKNTKQTTVTQFEVIKATADGGANMEMTMLSVKEENLNQVSEQQQEQQAASAAILKRMEGSKFKVGLDGKGEITKFDGYEDFVAKVSEGDARMARVFRSIMSPEVFQKMVTQTFSIVPNKNSEKGESWKQNQGMSLGPFGQVAIVRSIQHAGYVKSKSGKTYVALGMSGNARYQPPTKDYPGLPFKILDGDLKFEGITGKGYFDANMGRLVQLQVNLKMKGQLKIKLLANQQQATVDLEQSQSGKVRITNTNPLDRG